MILKIGDKVRFLNSVGGGTIKRFISKELVAVEEEDGFETPVLIKECVVIEPVRNSTPSQTESRKTEKSNSVMPAQQIVETKNGDEMNVALAFLPMDEKNIQTTDYELFLVNDSNYFLQFNYLSLQGKGWILRHSAIVEPNQQLFIEEISKLNLNDIEHICVQLLAYKRNKLFDLKESISVEFRIDAVKFYKLHSFQENDYFEDKAMLLYIVKKDKAIQQISINSNELLHALSSKGDFKLPVKQQNREVITTNVLEIDLHASQLLDSTSGMNNSEILQVQLDKFRSVMNENLKNKGKKVVFIHGKGEGVLRKAILDELKQKYKSCQFQDASFREYGFGATMIIIK
ncbi:MAG: DUF2027 domain-containing protein [Bacteroidales bacterium]